MPFVSQAQRAYAYATHQPWAAKFEAATPKGAKLPEHVGATTKTHPLRDSYERGIANKRRKNRGNQRP